jgi:O-methyltransferase
MTRLMRMIRYAFRRWGFLGTIARFLLVKANTKRFLASKSGILNKHQRRMLLRDFRRIHANIACAHSPYQFVLIANRVLELDVDGPIIECGCYKGGSSAKLSILAKTTNRRLYICDSFVGLPRPENAPEACLKGGDTRPDGVFTEGEYCATLEEVRKNIETCGCIDVCTFVPGFFETSLKDLHISPACVFIDVDLISSARECLKHLWPLTLENGLWFTHEASYPTYVTAILDADWWSSNLNEVPPVIFGAGSGLSECATGLAYFRKVPKRIGVKGMARQGAITVG